MGNLNILALHGLQPHFKLMVLELINAMTVIGPYRCIITIT
jgi:hypothetical protein